ncbi:MAG: hypothetical protein JNL09_07425 [Anaerolineales bacterium]|nr:hypothetical protein [Anaerolineales bacterium]
MCLNYEAEFELQRDLLKDLNKYAVEIRYPGESANKADARAALQALKTFRTFMRRKLRIK